MPSLDAHAAELRARLHAAPDPARVRRLKAKLGLHWRQAVILAALQEAGCAWIPAAKLALSLPLKAQDVGAVEAAVQAIRAMLGDEAVLCYVDVGYTLGGPGVVACRKALAGEP